MRTKVADFGVIITIASAVSFDYFMGLDTPKLNVPLKFQVKQIKKNNILEI